jgi:hypothetical protein
MEPFSRGLDREFILSGMRGWNLSGLILFPGIDFLFGRRQPPLGAGAAPNVPLPIQNPFAENWYNTILRPRLS